MQFCDQKMDLEMVLKDQYVKFFIESTTIFDMNPTMTTLLNTILRW